MILARCPACQTVFRVRPEQLRAHQGAVRCGHCYTPFDALANLVDEAPPAAPPGAAPAPPTVAPPETSPPAPTAAAATARDETPQEGAEQPASQLADDVSLDRVSVAGSDISLETDRLDSVELSPPFGADEPKAPLTGAGTDLTFDVPDRFSPSDYSELQPLVPASAFGSAPDALATPNPPSAAPDLDFVELPEPSRGESSHTVEANHGGAVAHENTGPVEDDLGTIFVSPDAAPATPLADERPENGETPRVEPQHDTPPDLPPLWATPTDTVHEARSDFTADERAHTPLGPIEPSSNARRTGLSLAVGLLLGALFVQAIFLFRFEIARDWPSLRPLLVAVCEQFGCAVDMPREAGQISIDTSDLQSEPADPARFVLSASVRNRAPFVQAFPHLELTLTDARDRPLVRRVFTPTEWTGRPDPEAGFASGEEIAVRLSFSAPGVDAAGYRLYIFYP